MARIASGYPNLDPDPPSTRLAASHTSHHSKVGKADGKAEIGIASG